MQKIPYVNLVAQWEQERDELLPLIDRAMSSGQYIGGKSVEDFESSAAQACGTKHCVSLNSGTDALVCGLLAMGVKRGDEVITPPNSFIASTAAIVHIGAKPVFVDVLPDQNIDPSKIEAAITDKTKAIMPVHLTGRMAKMDEIEVIAKKFQLGVIEDGAQAIGSRYMDIMSGKWGDIGCFSAHPLKNLNACGDGGFLVTDDDDIADKIKRMRNHGLIDRNTVTEFGYVSRLDVIQAVILNHRLSRLTQVIEKRRNNAKLYQGQLNSSSVFFPEDTPFEFNSYHTFVIQVDRRDELRAYLSSAGVETSIHYPIPIHLQPAARSLGNKLGDFPETETQAHRILTLPINQYIEPSDIEKICKLVNEFYG
jgi:dTDP-4-amino-4,6-dideoxygalactose transaminase